MSGSKNISPEHRQLLAVMAEVRSRLRELLRIAPTVPTELLGPIADRLTAALKARGAAGCGLPEEPVLRDRKKRLQP